MARVICPFCLKPHDFSSSLRCETYPEETVPNVYVKDYSKTPPLWLVTVGFSRHGKTTYLPALTLVLENISRVWGDVYYRHSDQYTIDAIRQMRREAIHGELPLPSPKKVPRPILFNVYALPESGSRCLVMYDVAGEIYDSLSEVQEYVTSIKQVSTTWFLVSLSDLEKDEEGKAITDLFQTYLSGMENLRINLEGRNLIVVYTKGDKSKYREFREYLKADPFQNLTLTDADVSDVKNCSFQDYIQKMNEMSEVLEDHTRERVRGGSAFINMVKASGMNLVFSVTSALGEDPSSASNSLSVNARRYRVLDPFLWSVTLESRESLRSIGLVIDATSDSKTIYSEQLLFNIWEELSEYGDVTIYYLGQSSPASLPGQRAPEAPLRFTRERLIGPMLEEASPGTRFIILSMGRIIDLADYYNSQWQDRLLLVDVNESCRQDWPNVISLRIGDDVRTVVDALLRLYD